MSRIEYLARCHCGVLCARYQTALDPSVWPVRACQCSFCRAHGALMTSDPAGSLEFRATDAGLVRRYRFGVRSANFLICRECRLFVGVQMESDEDRYGVLNVLALRPLLSGLPVAGPMDYGAETGVVRRLRHESNWTPVETTSL